MGGKGKEHEHGHEHGHGKDGEGIAVAAWLNLIADGVHNFSDGMAVAMGFMVSTPVGVTTAIAVFFHELPQEIGDYFILIRAGMTHTQALIANFVTALAAMGGASLVLAIGSSIDNAEIWILPLAAGGFIYIACADIIPDLHSSSSSSLFTTTLQLLGMGLGVYVTIALAAFE